MGFRYCAPPPVPPNLPHRHHQPRPRSSVPAGAIATSIGPSTTAPMVRGDQRHDTDAGFAAALHRRLSNTSDQVVLDIGTGPACLLALLAARAGARRVYAVEANAHAAERARASVLAAGYESVIVVLSGYSTAITLPEKADLLVAELVGSIASSEGLAHDGRRAAPPPEAAARPELLHSSACADALRARLLRPLLAASPAVLVDLRLCQTPHRGRRQPARLRWRG